MVFSLYNKEQGAKGFQCFNKMKKKIKHEGSCI